MKVCAVCHDEYRDHVENCVRCNIPLSAHGSAVLASNKGGQDTVDLATAVKVIEGPLPSCKEVEAILKQNKIASILAPVVNGNVTNYAVCINSDRVDDFMTVMKTRFEDMVQREHAQEWTLKEVNLDGSDVTCPACGHYGQLQAGQCIDCGLMLGVNEG